MKTNKKGEEEKLKSKARFNQRPMTGHSAFLAKRLAKGVSSPINIFKHVFVAIGINIFRYPNE